jgi:hypothetical protein
MSGCLQLEAYTYYAFGMNVLKREWKGVTRKHWLFRQMPRTEQGTQLCSRYGFHRVQHFSFKSKLE